MKEHLTSKCEAWAQTLVAKTITKKKKTWKEERKKTPKEHGNMESASFPGSVARNGFRLLLERCDKFKHPSLSNDTLKTKKQK